VNIFSAYDMIERLLGEVGNELGVKTNNGLTIMRMLLKRDLISPEILELYNTLRSARNLIAHERGTPPNEAETLEYVHQSAFLNAALYRVLSKIKHEGK
jgi:hypothetical protein